MAKNKKTIKTLRDQELEGSGEETQRNQKINLRIAHWERSGKGNKKRFQTLVDIEKYSRMQQNPIQMAL